MDEIAKNISQPKTVNKVSSIPKKDLDLSNLGIHICSKWDNNPWVTLLYTNPVEFKAIAIEYKNILDARINSGVNRPQITQQLKVLNNKIDQNISYVKAYIIEKYKKTNAESYFVSFGMIYTNKRFLFPKDQDKRSKALELMLTALETNGFADREFGVGFWAPIKAEFDALTSSATNTDSSVSYSVSNKNVLKAEVTKVLNSIILLIKANYPETYKGELRNWGFQKEKY